ncbi:MAG: hypothetical protein U1E26_08790 [Coriobacteriia bacterium]|nr:hypothetical protein [Coriobacteriia bacterium]
MTSENARRLLCRLVVLSGVMLSALWMPAGALASDDGLPGTARILPFGYIDTLASPDDWSDYSEFLLGEGQTLTVLMRSGTGTRFGVYLYGPYATAGMEPRAVSRTVASDATQQSLIWKAPEGGLYSIRVVMYEASADGGYAVHASTAPVYSIGRPSLPSRIVRNRYFTISGAIKPGYLFDGKPVTVQVQKKVGSRWSTKSGYLLSYRTAPYGSDDITVYLRGCTYAARAKLSAGRWRVRASIGDETMKRRYTAWREFTVK